MALRAFEAAARHLSFRKAAAELGVTPTAISHHMRALEERCGQELFRRRPRPLALTGPGERLYPVLRNGFDAFALAIESLSSNAARRPLRVTTPSAFAGRWLVPRIPRWRAAHADLALKVIGSDSVLDLRSGEADVAIRYARRMPAEFAGQEIFRDRYFPVCSPALLRAGELRRAADVLAYPLIHYDWAIADPDVPNWRNWLATARSVDPGFPQLEREWDLSFREETHAIEAVVAGQGIAVCSDLLVARELASGALLKAHALSLPGFGFYALYLREHPRQQIIEAFCAWLNGQASDSTASGA